MAVIRAEPEAAKKLEQNPKAMVKILAWVRHRAIPRPTPGPRSVLRPASRSAAQSHLLTDGFAGYRGRDADLGEHLKHTTLVQDEPANAGAFFSIIHTLLSNIKARLVGTHHGVSAKHLPRYLKKGLTASADATCQTGLTAI